MATSAPSIQKTEATIAMGMLREFERELVTTRRFLERIPEGKLHWRPHEKSMTVGQLALHIAESPAGALEMCLADEAPVPDFSDGRRQPTMLRQVLDQLDQSAEYVHQTLPKVDDARMRATFTVVQGGRSVMATPRADFLRAIMLNHWYHHRGQLGVYLRLLGASVPPSYGPSGDEGLPDAS